MGFPATLSAMVETQPVHLWDLLDRAAQSEPDNGLYFLENGLGENATSVSYLQLSRQAQANARLLTAAGFAGPGSITITYFDSHRSNVLWFWSIVAAGGICAILNPISNDSRTAAGQLENLSKLFGAMPTILTTRKLSSTFASIESTVHTVEQLGKPTSSRIAPAAHSSFAAPKLNDIALILFTSWGTGFYRASQFTHGQLIASVSDKADYFGTNCKTFMNWTSCGYTASFCQAHLQAMWVGGDQVFVPAPDLMLEPYRLYHLLGRFKIGPACTIGSSSGKSLALEIEYASKLQKVSGLAGSGLTGSYAATFSTPAERRTDSHAAVMFFDPTEQTAAATNTMRAFGQSVSKCARRMKDMFASPFSPAPRPITTTNLPRKGVESDTSSDSSSPISPSSASSASSKSSPPSPPSPPRKYDDDAPLLALDDSHLKEKSQDLLPTIPSGRMSPLLSIRPPSGFGLDFLTQPSPTTPLTAATTTPTTKRHSRTASLTTKALEALPPLQQTIARIYASILNVSPDKLLSPNALRTAGLKSLGLMRLKKALENGLQIPREIPMPTLVRCHTLADLEHELLLLLKEAQAEEASSAPSPNQYDPMNYPLAKATRSHMIDVLPVVTELTGDEARALAQETFVLDDENFYSFLWEGL